MWSSVLDILDILTQKRLLALTFNLKEEYEKWKPGEHFKICKSFGSTEEKCNLASEYGDIIYEKLYEQKKCAN
jgi:hypothetical protein